MENWKYCNAELEPIHEGYGHPYCPECKSESGMVNILGGCATKIETSEETVLMNFKICY